MSKRKRNSVTLVAFAVTNQTYLFTPIVKKVKIDIKIALLGTLKYLQLFLMIDKPIKWYELKHLKVMSLNPSITMSLMGFMGLKS